MTSEKAPPPENLPGIPQEDPEPSLVEKEAFRSRASQEEPEQSPVPNKPEDPKQEEEQSDKENDDEKSDKDIFTKNRSRDFLIVLIIFIAITGLYLFNIFILDYEKGGRDKGGPLPDEEVLFEDGKPSFYQGWITLEKGTVGSAIYPGREYVTINIVRENLSYLFLSDWSLVNSEGDRFFLGEASYLPFRGEVNEENPIVVDAGDVLVVNSGASPIGVSFRQNTCSGYLEQFQNFTPPIERKCPEFKSQIKSADRVCKVFVEALPQCEAVVDPLPDYLTPECKRFVQEEITYNGCVATYQGSPGFKGNIWRIFLDEPEQIWKGESGTITLFDDAGKPVDMIEY